MARDLYVKMLRSELFNPTLSSNALRLLLAIRSRADADETDGVLRDRVVAGLGIELGFSATRTRRLLTELRDGGYTETHTDGVRDVAFKDVCKSAEQRESERSDWRRRTKKHESSRRESEREADRESHGDSQNTPSPSPSDRDQQPKANAQSAPASAPPPPPPPPAPPRSSPDGRPTNCRKCHSGNISPWMRDSVRCLSCHAVTTYEIAA